jgi:alpha-beta hydrolase superfamily lysophospholipase
MEAMFKAEDIEALRGGLPAINFGMVSAPAERLQAYCKFYGLDIESLASGIDAEIHHSSGCFPAAGFRIACHHFFQTGSKGTAFVLHGYYDHVGLYAHLIRYFLHKRLDVVAFDLPGHGLSTGAQASIDSFSEYGEVLSECLQRAGAAGLAQPWHLVGQSTGATIAMDHCLRMGDQAAELLDKVVLLAPLIHPKAWARGRLLHTLLQHFVTGVSRDFADNSSDREFLHFVRAVDPLQSRQLTARWVGGLKQWLLAFEQYPPSMLPVQVIQGAADSTVDWRYNLKRIREKFPRAGMHMLAEARHHLVNESPEIRARIFQILDALFKETD